MHPAESPPRPYFARDKAAAVRRRFDTFIHHAVWRPRVSDFGARSRLYKPRLFRCPRGTLSIGQGVRISAGGRIESVRDATGGFGVIAIGDGVTVEEFCHIGAAVSVQIGVDTTIGPFVTILDHDHGLSDRLEKVLYTPLVSSQVSIGRAVWIGEKATILRGVHIGDGAVIGANAVVTKDVPARAIAVGSPARVVRYRNLM